MYQAKGRWALITGAARGIGYLTAKFMAEQGCNLILHSRDLSHTEKVLFEVRALGVEARAVAADLNDLDQVKRMLGEIDAMGVDVDIVLSSTVPTRDDYRFTGWNTESDGSGDSYAPGATYTTNAALNLYAQWVPIYNVSLKVGTEDFANWAISPTPAEAGQTVTATYSGKKKVKSVKAVKKPKGNGSLKDYNVTIINE